MTDILPQFRLTFEGTADYNAMVTSGNARFTMLDSRVIRLEYDASQVFEDRPDQVFWYRRQDVPDFTVEPYRDGVVIETDALQLRYAGGEFTRDSLQIQLKDTGAVWYFGAHDDENLMGTGRTLDDVSGRIDLDSGLLSRKGWSVIDSTKTLVFGDDGWLMERPRTVGQRDLVFFGFGTDHQGCLDAYIKLTGKTPLLPRWALGNWWSRYWAYTDQDLLDLMREFEAYDIPLSVCIVDMDWHITEVDERDVSWASGWTGYTWNKELFPDPAAFIQALHDKNLRTALNLHPHAGVQPHEAAYEDMARAMDIDPETRQPVRFDIADPKFVRHYFELLHHPKEEIGVDFWWMDWQQGEASSLKGLDPLWLLNHLHFYDLARDGERRPFIFSRWGGYGNHRYPIGFSGDTHTTWESLAFQPYFTATAANVAYGWWSHDIGGHYKGVEDAELYTRWVQFGIFSPIFRLHSSNNAFLDRRPWGWGDASTLAYTRDAMQLRHALVPYLYTLNHHNATDNVQPVRPMYHDYADADAAYAVPDQYLFGELVVAPFISPADEDTRLSRAAVWLPEGEWFGFFDGAPYAGDSFYAIYGRLSDIPVFAKAGTIVPLDQRRGWAALDNPAAFDVRIFTGADGEFTLYEDDGETVAYRDGAYCQTRFSQTWRDDSLTFKVHAAEGDTSLIPAVRDYALAFVGVAEDAEIEVNGDNQRSFDRHYDAETETLTVTLRAVPVNEGATVTLQAAGDSLRARRDRRYETALRIVKQFKLKSNAKAALGYNIQSVIDDPAGLAPYTADLCPSQRRALLETLHGVGVHIVRHVYETTFVVLWNNDERDGFRYRYTSADPFTFDYANRNTLEAGTVPRVMTLHIESEREAENRIKEMDWELVADYFGIASHITAKTGQID